MLDDSPLIADATVKAEARLGGWLRAWVGMVASGGMMAMVPGGAGARRRLVVRQRLRERRRDLGLTQKQVVNRLARLGVLTTNKALSSLEHGTGLDVAKLPELACALECTVTYLLGLTSEPAKWEPDRLPMQRPAPRPEGRAPMRTPSGQPVEPCPPNDGRRLVRRGVGTAPPARPASGPQMPMPPLRRPAGGQRRPAGPTAGDESAS
ncbi:MAG TPA: hypothetical protein VIL34_13250 [Actinopolymorphaceae bacterium]